ncbi:MAG: response regulator [Planctomycetaceae bacterium]
MSEKPHILVFGLSEAKLQPLVGSLEEHCQLTRASTLPEAIESLGREQFDGVCVLGEEIAPTAFLLEARGLLQQIPDGLALLDEQYRVIWHNARLEKLVFASTPIDGQPFFSLFRSHELLGPDFGPLHSALASGETARTLMRVAEKTFYELSATPIVEDEDELPSHLLATIRDVSTQTVERQKLDSIYRAGLELGDLQPQDVLDMSVDDRVNLLTEKILKYTRDVLEFETVEIRLVEPGSRRLKPLLANGMDPLAENRELYALPEGNGVTGFVAATGRSYLCDDTTRDPLYLPGAPGARSSLTVPLTLHEEIQGTFNVESPRPGAFAQSDLKFLELFCREVSIALNTLNLLEVEKATSANEMIVQMLRDIAFPADEILNDAAWVREQSRDGEVTQRLERVLSRTRQIRELIQKAGESMSCSLPVPGLVNSLPALRSKRILLADADQDIRRNAHELLGPCGCIVETARDGCEALLMSRTFHYDAAIVDIRLPDMSGSQLYRQLKERSPQLPIMLMTGFGYDAGHSLVKARQMGMQSTVFKPFRRDLLLKAVQDAVTTPPAPYTPVP